MLHFCENPGKLQTREELLLKMTGRELKPQDRTVDVTIRRIRKHFQDHPNTPEIKGWIKSAFCFLLSTARFGKINANLRLMNNG